MKVGLQTWGSDGDVRPMIALAAGLVRRGHEATIAIASVDNKDYGEMCRRVGVKLVRAPERFDVNVGELMARWGEDGNVLRMLRVLVEQVYLPGLDAMDRAAEEICAGSDVVVAHFMSWPMRVAALKTGRPHATVAFWPGALPSPARPPPRLPNLGRLLNPALWKLAQPVFDLAFGKHVRRSWRQHGLEPRQGILTILVSESLSLLAVSPTLWSGERDWAQHRICGCFRLPEEAEPEPFPPALEAFLAAGDAPVFLALGSSGSTDPERGEALLLAAAEQSGLRAIVQLNPGRSVRPASERIFQVGRVCHARLFPRCAAVVHHAGSGTTHTVLTAQRPSVVVAFMDEQISWGSQLVRLGAARRVFRYPKVSAEQLAEAMREAAGSAEMRRCAEEHGRALQKEDGVGRAVQILEALAAGERT